jgi:hypothetical protein
MNRNVNHREDVDNVDTVIFFTEVHLVATKLVLVVSTNTLVVPQFVAPKAKPPKGTARTHTQMW